MSEYQCNVRGLPQYEPILGEQAPKGAFWGAEFGIFESILYNYQPDSLVSYPHFSTDFSLVQESTASSDAATLVFDTSDPLNNFSPFQNHSSLLIEPSILHGELTSFPSIATSPPNERDEIICDKVLLDSVAVTRRNDRRNGKRHTKRTDNDITGMSLQFAQVMKSVRKLASGEKPKNALFTPFFKRDGRLYVCLLCPTKAAKTISNRTQIIQHISGWHGENRPFACTSCRYRAIRKADLEKHTSEVHGSLKYNCPKCSKSFSNRRNTRRHEKICLTST